MRVLHVAAGNLFGGVERILVEIARATGGARHQFALCFAGAVAAELAAVRADVTFIGGVRFSRPWSVSRARRRLSALLRERAFDAVVCHAPWSYAVASPVLASSARVLWAHDASGGAHWTERRVHAAPPALVICNSRYTESALRSWMAGMPFDVVYAPVSPIRTDAAVRRDTRRALAAADGTTVFIIASRLERWKGHLDLLRALRGVRGDWVLWMAGGPQRPAEADYAREIESEAARLGLVDRVRRLGQRDDVASLLAGADVHVQPNTSPEPFGIAFVEALSAGLPVVTTRGGGAAEIVTSACGVLVQPGDARELTAALQRLVDDPAHRRALGSEGPARAAALCDPEAQVRRLEAALASLSGAAA